MYLYGIFVVALCRDDWWCFCTAYGYGVPLSHCHFCCVIIGVVSSSNYHFSGLALFLLKIEFLGKSIAQTIHCVYIIWKRRVGLSTALTYLNIQSIFHQWKSYKIYFSANDDYSGVVLIIFFFIIICLIYLNFFIYIATYCIYKN